MKKTQSFMIFLFIMIFFSHNAPAAVACIPSTNWKANTSMHTSGIQAPATATANGLTIEIVGFYSHTTGSNGTTASNISLFKNTDSGPTTCWCRVISPIQTPYIYLTTTTGNASANYYYDCSSACTNELNNHLVQDGQFLYTVLNTYTFNPTKNPTIPTDFN